MTKAAIGSTIRSRMATEWPTLQPSIPVLYDNTGQAAPKDSAYVNLTILFGDSFQVEMGNLRRLRNSGLLTVQIFVPTGVGDGLAQELGDSVGDVFQLRTVSGVIFRATSLLRVGVDGPWLQYNASTPFQQDDLI